MKTKLFGKVEQKFFTETTFFYKDEMETEQRKFPSLNHTESLSYSQKMFLKSISKVIVSPELIVNKTVTLDEIKKIATISNPRKTTKPAVTLHGMKINDDEKLLRVECHYSVVISEKIEYELNVNELKAASELDSFIKKHGFYSNYNELLEDLTAGINTLELTKKAYGDSYQMDIQHYFKKTDYRKLTTLCKKLKLIVPEYIYAD